MRHYARGQSDERRAMRIIGYWANNPGMDIRARILWDEGISAGEIGRRLGCGKNSLISLARRREWPHRPSPITPGVFGPRKPRASRAKAAIAARAVGLPPPLSAGPVTLPPLASDAILLPVSPSRKKPPKPVNRPVQSSKHRCEWLDGHKPFKRCTEAAWSGYPYCETHCRKAYVNWRGAAAEEAA
jgi:hypothetical protein